MTGELELSQGSGDVWQDFGYPDADLRQAKGIIAARIIGALADRKLSTRKAAALTGFAAAGFSRVRNADYGRFTLDRLIRMLHALDETVEVQIRVEPRGRQPDRPAALMPPDAAR
jgi:predicted XRE-type DNA-binding protein